MAKTSSWFNSSDVAAALAEILDGKQLSATDQHEHEVVQDVTYTEATRNEVPIELRNGQRFLITVEAHQ